MFFDDDHAFGPAGLYDAYTNLSFYVDWNKGETRQLLTIPERQQFAQALAIAMFDNSKLEITYSEILVTVSANSKVLSAIERRLGACSLEQIVTDIQLCTFITRTQYDSFRFIHRSFMEYFVASFLKATLAKQRPDHRFEQVVVGKEIACFIGSFSKLDRVVAEGLERLVSRMFDVNQLITLRRSTSPYRKREDCLRRNALMMWLYYKMGASVLLNVIYEVELNSFEMKDLEFADTRLRRVCIARSIVKKIRFEKCLFEELAFVECRLNEFSLRKCSGKIDFQNSAAETLLIRECDLTCCCKRSGANHVKVIRSKLVIIGDLSFSDVIIDGGSLTLGDEKASERGVISLHEGVASGLRLIGISSSVVELGQQRWKSLGRLSAERFRFEKCTFYGVELSIRSLEADKAALVGCDGFVIATESEEQLKQEERVRSLLQWSRPGMGWFASQLQFVCPEVFEATGTSLVETLPRISTREKRRRLKEQQGWGPAASLL